MNYYATPANGMSNGLAAQPVTTSVTSAVTQSVANPGMPQFYPGCNLGFNPMVCQANGQVIAQLAASSSYPFAAPWGLQQPFPGMQPACCLPPPGLFAPPCLFNAGGMALPRGFYLSKKGKLKPIDALRLRGHPEKLY